MNQREIELLESQVAGRLETFNPFPGLRPFGFEESHLFFGREGQSDEVLMNLARHRFTSVIGASGSGKSSLMYCGLIPVLFGGFMTQAGSDWVVIVTRPGISPVDNMAESILVKDEAYINSSDEEKEINRTITTTFLRSSSMGLVDALKQVTGGNKKKNVFILIDQFEELFRHIKSEGTNEAFNEASVFVNLIIKSVTQTEVPVYVALTMRSDFIGDCAQFPELTHLINKSHYLIPQMTRDQQRLAIEGPIAVAGGKISKRLVQQLLNDIGNNPDQLPVLQHALMRTWDYWIKNKRETDESLDLKHYIAIGRISEALSQHANEAFSELNSEQKLICEKLFKELTEKGSDNSGVRRAARLDDIAMVADVSIERVKEVVDIFRMPGRSLLMPPANVDLNEESVIEISHESLMRIWVRLKRWVEEEAESAAMYKRISEAAEMYLIGRTSVWRPPDLQLALTWLKKQEPTVAWAKKYNPQLEKALIFIETSKKTYDNEQKGKALMQKRMLTRTKRVAVALGIAAIISGLFFVFGWIQKIESDKAAELAKQREKEAIESSILAEEQRTLAIQGEEIAKEAKLEAEKARTEAIQNAEIALKNERRANVESQRAIDNFNIAEQKRLEADKANKEAQVQREQAVIARDKAYELRLLSISQSMAVKSLTEKDEDLKGLLAMHSYNIHDRYGENNFDKYVYDGLYYAAKTLNGEDYNILDGHTDLVRSICHSNNEDAYFTTGSDGKVLKWTSGSEEYELLYRHEYINYDLKLSPDEKFLVVAGTAPYILILDLENSTSTKVQAHEGPVSKVIFMPNGNHFLSLGILDNSLRINDFEKSQLVKKFESKITSLAMSADGSMMASGEKSGKLTVWYSTNIDDEFTFDNVTSNSIHSLNFSNNGDMLAVGNEEGVVFICDIRQGLEDLTTIHGLAGQSARINDIKFSSDDKLIATASWEGSIQIWVMDKLDNLPMVFLDHKDYVWSIEFSRDNSHLITGSKDGNVKLWPTDVADFKNDICDRLLRKRFTRTEWSRYVGADIPYEITCK